MATAKKINFKRAVVIYAVIDFIQFIIDFTGVGEVVNEVVDVFIGMSVEAWAWRTGQADLLNTLIAVGTFAGEEATAAAAPLWFLDIIAFQARYAEKMAASGAFSVVQGIQKGIRQPAGRPAPTNRGGRREPPSQLQA